MSSWKREQVDAMNKLMTDQFEFNKQMTERREAERVDAMSQMQSLLKNAPQYKIPGQVQQYTDLMNTLGAQLYGLQDASGGQKSIDPNRYRSQSMDYGMYGVPTSSDIQYPERRNASSDPGVYREPVRTSSSGDRGSRPPYDEETGGPTGGSGEETPTNRRGSTSPGSKKPTEQTKSTSTSQTGRVDPAIIKKQEEEARRAASMAKAKNQSTRRRS